ncbi:MAG: tetratricopeptide repeat protein [Anaerolineae bacterium]|nr:tetratricopeptide repeat protein [Anaerolineae bacterium]
MRLFIAVQARAHTGSSKAVMPPDIHKLEERLKAASTDRDRIDVLNALCDQLTEIDPQRVFTLAEEARTLSEKIEYPLGAVMALLHQSWAAHVTLDYATSVRRAFQGLELARLHHFPRQEADALNILGANHDVVGNRPDALEAFLQALKISKEIGDDAKVSGVLTNVALVYSELDRNQEGIPLLEQAMELDRQSSKVSSVNRAITMTTAARLHTRVGQHEQALELARQAFTLLDAAGFTSGAASALIVLGAAHAGMKQPAQALEDYQKALTIALGNPDSRFEAGEAHREMGQLLIELGRAQESLPHLERALALFTELETRPDVYKTHQILSRAHKLLGQYQAALEHFEQFQSIKERVYNEQADLRLKTLHAVYDLETAKLEAQAQTLRNQTLQKEIDQREKLIADLDAYASNVAHDLKNPIGVISAYSSLLVSDLEGEIDAEDFKLLQRIETTADTMERIVNALLSLAKLRREQIRVQAVDMNAIVSAVEQRLQPMIDKFAARLTVDRALPPALGHAIWLEEVWTNYLSNAIKYGGSPPEIAIGATVVDEAMVRYSVRDNGNGVSPELQPNLFGRFERLGQQRFTGHGLGLAIVREIIEKLGGAVGIISEGKPGEGATFFFTLPRAPEPRRTVVSVAASQPT